ncbi:hypothetical protein [Profundibacterium mesophilum]|uniref:Glutamine amidotransferase domain-containing protein n=1 Tax=Profundibacterium mesophilum KAUST100406-0324 TaxID=1037889 RepID=A0A921NVX8_9RHOB|nr:hypothetical protein [Profundibacterium mesophilum]KAF0674543.1 hypothetical protein PMES_03128 [Profundibacterium mesophilum KAUST100406-0324]
MNGEVVFDPLLPWAMLWAAAALGAALCALSLWRRQAGWWLRGLAAAMVLIALANPSLQRESRSPLGDIVLLVVDESASQRIGGRAEQTEQAVARIEARIAGLENTELRIVRLGDGPGDDGTLLMTALAQAISEEPADRIAGAILLSDGRLHDIERAPELPAPLHLLLTGMPRDWDRRLVVSNAPAFAIIGEPVTLSLRLEDQGRVPEGQSGTARIEIAVDGGEPRGFDVPVGETLELPVTLPHGGRNVIRFSTPAAPGELTDRNNAAVIQINGVRDRLRVLLVSGEPHQGERVWRNLLKSDSSVDLVHFTILRPPEKQDGVPVDELSLIAFPTRELFLDKIDEFDLIIFDRYKRRGILPQLYFDNVRRYVVEGGAVLVAAGPDFAGVDSLYRSALGDVLPGAPTARVIEEPFLPRLSDVGTRHPVTQQLDGGAQTPEWGRWLRQVELEPRSGEVVMEGADGQPLLLLDRVGEGRVALLGSDHAWLWSRGFEGGGPQLELLRRLAHWLMKEPELDEEALVATAEGQTITIERRTLSQEAGEVEITGPDGQTERRALEQTGPGRFQTVFEAPQIGLYRLVEGDRETVIGIGPAAPREFEQTVASGAALGPAVAARRGAVLPVSEGVPDIREVRPGRPAGGRGWIGITPRQAYLTTDLTLRTLLPAWLLLLAAAGLTLAAWMREGRR